MWKCDYEHRNGEGAKSSTKAPHSSCRQHWQSTEMEDRGSTFCQSAREPILSSDRKKRCKHRTETHSSPPYLCFLWQARKVYVPSNARQINFPEEAIFKEGTTFAMDGNNKTGVFLVPGQQGSSCSSDTRRSSQRSALRWGSKNNNRMKSIRNRQVRRRKRGPWLGAPRPFHPH